jgi:hypothetical protein
MHCKAGSGEPGFDPSPVPPSHTKRTGSPFHVPRCAVADLSENVRAELLPCGLQESHRARSRLKNRYRSSSATVVTSDGFSHRGGELPGPDWEFDPRISSSLWMQNG